MANLPSVKVVQIPNRPVDPSASPQMQAAITDIYDKLNSLLQQVANIQAYIKAQP